MWRRGPRRHSADLVFWTALQAKSYLRLRLKMPFNSRVFIQHTQGPGFHLQFHEGEEEKRQRKGEERSEEGRKKKRKEKQEKGEIKSLI